MTYLTYNLFFSIWGYISGFKSKLIQKDRQRYINRKHHAYKCGSVTVQSTYGNSTVSVDVYIDGVLNHRTIGDANTRYIHTEIFDLEEEVRMNSTESAINETNGFFFVTTHSLLSESVLEEEELILEPQALVSEPVDNTGLTRAPSGLGGSDWYSYYYLGNHGGYYYAPSLYGDLYRSYTQAYVGETAFWTWDTWTTIGAIIAAVGMVSGPAFAVLDVVSIATNYVDYRQSVRLATYDFHYTYRVRVSGAVHFITHRNITNWRIENVTEGRTTWERKSFNGGFSMANVEMVKAGIDRYLEVVY